MLVQPNQMLRSYNVVMLNPRGPNTGVVSRHAGSSRKTAIESAKTRRADFPEATYVRVICSREGIIAEF